MFATVLTTVTTIWRPGFKEQETSDNLIVKDYCFITEIYLIYLALVVSLGDA